VIESMFKPAQKPVCLLDDQLNSTQLAARSL